jgi:hypothetical protein
VIPSSFFGQFSIKCPIYTNIETVLIKWFVTEIISGKSTRPLRFSVLNARYLVFRIYRRSSYGGASWTMMSFSFGTCRLPSSCPEGLPAGGLSGPTARYSLPIQGETLEPLVTAKIPFPVNG